MSKIRKNLLCAALAANLTLLASAQSTAFTYQGRLNDGVNPASGLYDLRFKLFTDPFGNNQLGGAVVSNAVPVSNGLFLVALDFGQVFSGTNYWLEVDVKTNTAGAYANLSPLQALTPTPYAVFAASAGGVTGPLPSGSLSGTYGNTVNLNNAGNLFSGSFTGNGGGLTNLNVSTLGGLNAGQFWQTSGNSNTVGGANFLGTLDNQPLELKVNNQRALRLEPNTNGAPNVIAGSPWNTVVFSNSAATISGGLSNNIGSNAVASTISGGLNNTITSNALYATVGGGVFNRVTWNYATVNGGYGNLASGNFAGGGDSATVGGGFQNSAVGNNSVVSGGALNVAQGDNTAIGGGWYNTNRGPAATIGGGQYNLIHSNVFFSTIGGGANHTIGTNSSSSTISGGYFNTIAAYTTDVAIGGGSYNSAGSNTYYAVIAGGRNNTIANNAQAAVIGGGYANYSSGSYSVVPGGYENLAAGSNSFAAGTLAYAGHNGTFVWNDITSLTNSTYFISSGPNQFLIHATGGVGINTNNPSGAALQVAGTVSATSFQGSLQGDGSGVINLNAGNFSSGTFPDGRLSGNIPRINANQTFTGSLNIFGDIGLENGSTSYHHLELSGGNALGYLYGSFNGLADGIHLGYNCYYDTGGTARVFNPGGATSRITTGYGFVGLYVGGVNAAPTIQRLYADTTHIEVDGTFNNNSDRNAKQNFAPVSPKQILEKVEQLPVSEWSYKDDPTTRHVGPMAQDFRSAFNIGTDERHIAPIDEGGIALAAIQGLNQKLETQNQKLEAENEELKARLDAIERLLKYKATR